MALLPRLHRYEERRKRLGYRNEGGESHGESKNIDKQIGNKFNAFKEYAARYGLNWGFVRDLDGNLYINNTEFILDMADEHWQPLEDVFV